MKIVLVVLGVAVCVVVWLARKADDVAGNSDDRRPSAWTFGKYYKPYEADVKPKAPDYALPLDLNSIVNVKEIEQAIKFSSISSLIRQNGFGITDLRPRSPLRLSVSDDLVDVYRLIWEYDIPLFISVDAGLYLYHALFDETLRDIEENVFVAEIKNLTITLLEDALEQHGQLEGDVKEAAKRNVAYLAVANKLIDPHASTPELVDDTVASELGKIEAHVGFMPSDIFIYEEDYSQYVPRGRYMRSEALKRYSRTMTWYGRMSFLLEGGPQNPIREHDAKIQTLQAFLLAASLKNVKLGRRSGLDVWNRLHAVTAFYAGRADDLNPHDYLWAMEQTFGSEFALNKLADEENLQAVRKKLDMVPSPRIHRDPDNIAADGPNTSQSVSKVLGKARGLRLMGRSFEPGSNMLRHLVSPQLGGYVGDPNKRPFTVGPDGSRAYPRALDVMALLGSREALEILTDEGDTSYQDFSQRFDELKGRFDSLAPVDWNVDRCWSWLYPIRALLQEAPNGYPKFATTEAWRRCRLNSALASWTQLGHDTVFHRKRVFVSPPIRYIGGRPLQRLGYVEPTPIFWGRLLSLTRMMHRGLAHLKVLTPQSRQRLQSAEDLLERTCKIAVRQLKSARISSKDRRYFDELPFTLGSIVQPKEEKDHRPQVTTVADVHANPSEETVVEAAVGQVDLLVVACPMTKGRVFLAIGPVLSFYEFKRPTSDRLTDETWRQLLDSPVRPSRPQWYAALVQRGEDASTGGNMTVLKRLTGNSAIVGRLDWSPHGLKRLTVNSTIVGRPDWSPDGRKIALASRMEGQAEIYVINTDGTQVQRLTDNPARDMNPSWSSDGEKIAFDSDRDGQSEVYVMNADGSGVERLTDNPTADTHPRWSPTEKQIVFMSEREGNAEIYVMNADGSEVRRLTTNPSLDVLPSWSPTGEQIAFMSNRDGNSEIYVMNADGSGQKNLTSNEAVDTAPSWSPDGKRLAFHSFRDGKIEIYVMNVDGSQQARLTNITSGEVSPSWSPDGKKLAFILGTDSGPDIYIVDLDRNGK